jgi:hypothetical protein
MFKAFPDARTVGVILGPRAKWKISSLTARCGQGVPTPGANNQQVVPQAKDYLTCSECFYLSEF